MKKNKKGEWRGFLLFSAALVLGLALFPLYIKYMWHGEGKDVIVCYFPKIFKLYCPLCGATRALWALLHFDLFEAFVFNPFLVIAVGCFAFCYIRRLVNLIRGCGERSIIPIAVSRILLCSAAAVMLLRAVLLVAFGYDPLGELGEFWRGVWH